ncbi:innexin-3 domain protein [Oesophagostomum dentatum]|uniref:Innexin n=1 Tax=Oesophagostomum dentatum TaxID=61180 RepID=A0A0B1T4J4_OESDE|nr:innexin-3 domain protein [Oesophagostomum dentatum]
MWGYKLTLALLFSKLLSIAVVVGEILFTGWFMGAGQMHGLRVVVDALNGRQWESSGNFPRVTFCDLQVRELGGAVHRWSLQCVLMINMFNEKIFVFLWWWFCILLFISILNFFRWIVRLSFDSQRAFVTAVLEAAMNEDVDSRDVSDFCKSGLKTDGTTIVHLIEENATIYQAGEFLVPLWQEFMNAKSKVE